MLPRISLQSDRYGRIHLSVMKQRDPARAEHRELLELAQQGDVDGAAELLQGHILRTRDALLTLVAAQRSQTES